MRLVSLESVSPEMKLGEAIYSPAGLLLLAQGAPLTPDYVAKLRGYGLPAVYVDDGDTRDIEPAHAISPALRGKVVKKLSKAFEALGQPAPDAPRDGRAGSSNAPPPDPAATGHLGALYRPPEALAQELDAVVEGVDHLLGELDDRDVLIGLNSIKTHDDYTYQHSIDVAIVGSLLARRAGWNRRRMRDFAIGCILHDIGKVFVEPAILNKAGPLTPAEFERVKTHPTLGYELIKVSLPRLGSLVPQVAYQHHERQDGSGYPRGLKGNNKLGQGEAQGTAPSSREAAARGGQRRREPGNPLLIHDFGSLCAVADVYDALTAARPYRPGYSPDRVVEAISRMSGSHLNQEAVGLFLSVVSPYPVCAEVRVLDGKYAGWIGVVASVPAHDLAHPLVRLLHDSAGKRVAPVDLDLAVERDVRIEGSRGGATPQERRPGGVAAARPAPLPDVVQQTLRQLTTAGAWARF